MTTALIISDLHVGGNEAIMPPVVKINQTATREAQTIHASPMQCEIYDRYCQTIKDAGKVDCCLVLGDMVDGVDRHGEGAGVWTTDRRVQVDTAYTLLSMAKTKEYYCVQGTRYHVDSNLSTDHAVADKLRATFGPDLVVNLDGIRIHMNHKIGHSRSPVSKLTAPAGEIAQAEIHHEYYGRFDVLLRGHRHDRYDIRYDTGPRIAGCPSWKSRDHFAATNGLGMPAKEIGALLLHIEKKKGRTVHMIEPLITKMKPKHQFTEVTVPLAPKRVAVRSVAA